MGLVMARTGRPRLPPETVALVRDLLAIGSHQEDIAAAAGISRRSVQFIAEADGPSPDALEMAPGERFVDPPVRCEHGHRCSILPCRTCARMPNRKLLDRLAAAETKAASLGIPLNPPRRRRTKRTYELSSQLKPGQQKRLEEIRGQKRMKAEG